jgi:23S rRNA pseudouridine2604 synthase
MLRLNKYISDSGLCSRRVADTYIEKGLVFINGRRAVIGDKVSSKDVVKVNGQVIEAQSPEDFILLAYNKPVGITCTTESSVKGNIVDHVNHSARLFPIGRLDKDSQGLIFMTNNGDIVNKLLRAGNNHEKEYVVTVDKPITDAFLEGMSSGVPILGVMTKKCKITQESQYVFRIILVQGLNRQIRRMSAHFGYEVTKLERVRIMNIGLKGLPIGDWRDLSQQEIDGIFSLIEGSSSDAKSKKGSPKNSNSAIPNTSSKRKTNQRKPFTSKSVKTRQSDKPGSRKSGAQSTKARPKLTKPKAATKRRF